MAYNITIKDDTEEDTFFLAATPAYELFVQWVNKLPSNEQTLPVKSFVYYGKCNTEALGKSLLDVEEIYLDTETQRDDGFQTVTNILQSLITFVGTGSPSEVASLEF